MNERLEKGMRVPLRVWATRVDEASLQRLKRLARSDRLAGPVAVMPDVHAAGDVCVGTVFASEDAVFPTAVGEDLGCGMLTQAFSVEASALSRERLVQVLANLAQRVPVGRRSHTRPQELPEPLRPAQLSTHALAHAFHGLGTRHLGTLGGGNHFVEFQRDSGGRLWVSVHSGSRGVGAAIAAHHSRKASQGSCTGLLPFFERGSPEERAFWGDLTCAIAFAAHNRAYMLDLAVRSVEQVLGVRMIHGERYDLPHNLIAEECHGGRSLVVHRKGAMPAHAGARGLVPGSMGTASYLVEGLGAAASFASCSHGAGRRLSRTEARRTISPKELLRQIAHVVWHDAGGQMPRALVEEAPAAYKDIKQVIAEQADLVRPLLRLEPIAVLKGD